MTKEQLQNQESHLPTAKASSWNLFAPENRGILFDIVIFLVNILLMQVLTRSFTDMGRSAYNGNRTAQIAVFLFFVTIFLLQPIGAAFRRWDFHKRRRDGRKRKKSADGYIFTFAEDILTALIFNPLLYFFILLFTSGVIISFMNELIIGKSVRDDDSLFIVFVLVGFLVTVVHSVSVYIYFTSPKREPKQKFLYRSWSPLLGDLLLFVNIVLFQILWNIVAQIPSAGNPDLGGFLIRTIFVVSMALLVYFPARIFYSAEDIRKPLAWFTILLANLPVIVRVLNP